MSLPHQAGTIFALSSAAGRAGVAVLRVSGPRALNCAQRLCGAVPKPRQAALRRLRDPESGEDLDRGLVLTFPGPASFTGEDVVEFHIHGGRAVVAGVLEALAREPGLRPAEAGEFTRRAFENGKMDLTEVEGLADLIDAETEAQRRLALRQMDGALGRLTEAWRSNLVESLAYIEAEIDFPDEDVPDAVSRRAGPLLKGVYQEIQAHLADEHRGERLRDGVSAAILGVPNAGKSSLLNALAKRDAAIVSDRAGTTRDVVEVHLDLGGYPVGLADTAGLRDAAEEIEGEGVRRALARAESADIRLVVFDGSQAEIDERSRALLRPGDLAVVNKSDCAEAEGNLSVLRSGTGYSVHGVSALTGAGMEAFLAALEARVVDLAGVGEAAVLTRARHRRALEDCAAALERALADLDREPELLGEDVRLAARALGRITGRVDVEDVLDVVFGSFCIGK